MRLRIGGGGSVWGSSLRTFNWAIIMPVKADRAVESPIGCLIPPPSAFYWTVKIANRMSKRWRRMMV